MSLQLRETFKRCAEEQRPAFVAYVTAGFPDAATTPGLLLALQEGGADVIELGVPFTDPLADGPVIQHSTHVALQNGTDLDRCLQFVEDARKQGLKVPVLLMGYYNPFLQYGEERVMIECARVGVNGFIVVDLPPEEAIAFRDHAQRHGLSYVPLIAPSTSDNRIAALAKIADTFIYVVSRLGVTGVSADVNADLPQKIANIRRFNATIPLAVGFGVANRDHFVTVGSVAEGVVIGSKFINILRDAEPSERLSKVKAFASEVSGVGLASRRIERLSSGTHAVEVTDEALHHLVKPNFILNPRFGEFGGQYVPEALVDCLSELEAAFVQARDDPAFWKEFHDAYTYLGRPSPLHLAQRMTDHAGGARIWLKREDLNHTGSHKINNALGQILLARRLGKTRIIAETGAGQHGVATATVCAKFGLECVVYMGAEDCERQQLNVFRIKLLGGTVIPVESGSRTLKDAINEAMRDWVTNVSTTHYLVGSAIGPHPFPTIVKEYQSVIGKETRQQMLDQAKKLPDCVIACVGGGSNSIGMFAPFVEDQEVGIVGVEAAGDGIHTEKHSATLTKGVPGVLHGTRTYLLQDAKGQISSTHSISAGLDYPGVGPEHAWLKHSGRARYIAATDTECLEGFQLMAKLEGIIPALETSHAAFVTMQVAKELGPGKDIVLCVSGRGDKDVDQVLKVLAKAQ
ncbi:hypothetical protein RI367_002826 [Sorochytrium milnesiophthora]